MNEIRYIDLFSGIGGFRLGLQRAGGFRCVWSCDWDKHANKVYIHHWGKQNHFADDIQRVNPEEIPDHDLLCAGFPCQSFSTAGKRKGFQDYRGTLFFEICRITEFKRASLLLLENVDGLRGHENGRTLATILGWLEKMGYWWEYRVLDSQYFGVPQQRERIFIIGHLGEKGGRSIFSLRENDQAPPRGDGTPTSRCLTGGGHSGGLHSSMEIIAVPVLTPKRLEKRQHGRRFRNHGDPAFTLTSTDDHGIWDGYRFRGFTPIEKERLQGFPDNWTSMISKSQRGKTLGNAVTVDVIEFLGRRILSEFTNMDEKE